MGTINEQFLISLAIIAIGYIAKRSGLISRSEGQTLSKIILNVTLPALILVTFADITLSPHLLLLSLICIAYGVALLFISRVLFKKEVRQNKGAFIISMLGFNVGLFAYPFVESIWGSEGLKHMAIFDMGNALLIFGLAYITAVLHAPGEKQVSIKFIAAKMATFVPLLCYVAAVSISLLNITLPPISLQVFETLASANSILVLLVIGIYLNFSLEKSLIRPFLKVVTFKYLLGISTGVLLYVTLPFDELFRATLLLGLVLPVGMAIIPYAVQNELNDKVAGGLVNLTNIISFVLMWLIFVMLQ